LKPTINELGLLLLKDEPVRPLPKIIALSAVELTRFPREILLGADAAA
jgi:hypothetical protein